PSKLIQIRKTKTVRAVDDDRIGVWYIQTTFDDCRGNQNVRLAADKALHHIFQFLFVHLTMTDVDPRARTKNLNPFSNPFDCLHSIVEKINLPVAMTIALNRVAYDPFVVSTNHRFNWQSIGWRRLND